MYLHKDHKIGVISNHLKEKKKSNIQTVFVKKKKNIKKLLLG